jgi:hypothetical protein
MPPRYQATAHRFLARITPSAVAQVLHVAEATGCPRAALSPLTSPPPATR